MGRPIRIEYPAALYHITSRGNERKKIFLEDGDRVKFLKILEDYHDRYGILIHSYVLMDNHYHLVLETPRGNLLKVMHGINSSYTGYFNRKYGRSGHLFQGRYRGILVEKDTYLLSLSRYVHLNPVRGRVVERPERYRWSSYPEYIGKGKESEWVEYAWVLSQFGKDKKRAKRRYRKYTEEGLKVKEKTPLRDLHGQVILGGEGFVGRIKGMLKGKRLSEGIVERKRLMEHPSLLEVVGVVSEAFGINQEEIWDRGGRGNIARKVAIYFCQRYTGLSNEALGEMFGGIHYSTVSKVTARVGEEMFKNKELSKLMDNLDSHFKA
jgi:REP element-mobilizing transposase RayT